jgi:hypothetical protein
VSVHSNTTAEAKVEAKPSLKQKTNQKLAKALGKNSKATVKKADEMEA